MRTSVVSKGLMRYIYSVVAITLISCCMVGTFILYTVTTEHTAVKNDIAETRMIAALDDINAQVDVLEDIALNMSLNYQFQRKYWSMGEYYQWQMLKSMQNYTDWSAFAKEFFLVYDDNDYVFLSSGLKSYRKMYAHGELNVEPEWFDGILQRRIGTGLVRMNDNILLLLPMHTEGYNTQSGYATLCIVLKQSELVGRLEGISGISGNYALYHNGKHILGPELNEGRSIITVNNGGFTMKCYAEEITLDGMLRSISPGMVIVILLLVTMLAVSIAYRNYRPIRRLASKYMPEWRGDELPALDAMIAAMIRSGDENREMMRERFESMKPIVLKAILHGKYKGSIEETMRLLGLPADKPHYKTYVIGDPHNSGDAEDGNRLSELIKDLSDGNIVFCAAQCEDDNCIAVISSLTARYMENDATALLMSLVDEYAHECFVSEGLMCDSMDGICESYMYALNGVGNAEKEFSAAKELEAVFEAVRTGDIQLTQESLDIWAQRMATGGSRYSEKIVLHDMLTEFVREMREGGLSTSTVCMNEMICARSVAEFAAVARTVCEAWCENMNSTQKGPVSNRGQEICEYIKVNYSDPELSLDLLANKFGISVNHICRLIKQNKGRTFRDYLIRLRLEEAERLLLQQEGTVADVCVAVGYSNLSYFIRSFKDYTGMTPSEFRRVYRV